MENQMEKVYKGFIKDGSFILKDMERAIHNNLEHPIIKEISKGADYPIWGNNYIASILNNLTKKRIKNPKFKRRKNQRGLWEYLPTDQQWDNLIIGDLSYNKEEIEALENLIKSSFIEDIDKMPIKIPKDKIWAYLNKEMDDQGEAHRYFDNIDCLIIDME